MLSWRNMGVESAGVVGAKRDHKFYLYGGVGEGLSTSIGEGHPLLGMESDSGSSWCEGWEAVPHLLYYHIKCSRILVGGLKFLG